MVESRKQKEIRERLAKEVNEKKETQSEIPSFEDAWARATIWEKIAFIGVVIIVLILASPVLWVISVAG